MYILDWKDNKIVSGLTPVFSEEDEEDIFFHVIGGIGEKLKWTASLHKASKHNADVKDAYYAKINIRTSSDLDIKRTRYGYHSGTSQIIVGFAPIIGIAVPAELSEIEPEDYPITLNNSSRTQLSQDQIRMLEYATKEASSLLAQINVKYENAVSDNRERFPRACVRSLGPAEVLVSWYNVYGKKYRTERFRKPDNNIRRTSYYSFSSQNNRFEIEQKTNWSSNYIWQTCTVKRCKQEGHEFYDKYQDQHPDTYQEINTRYRVDNK